MKKSRIVCTFLILSIMFNVVFPVIFAANKTVEMTIAGYRDYDYARAVFEYTNLQRKNDGLSVLTYDKALTEAAMRRAEEIALNFSHTRPDGTKWSTVSNKANGENIAAGQESPDEVISSWMHSDGHRENILRSRFKSIGIGCFFLYDTFYWVQLFSASNASSQPTQTGKTEVYETTVEISTSKVGNIIVDFSKRKLNVKVGETLEVIQVYLENGEYIGDEYLLYPVEKSSATFTSSNNNIATIDSNGTIYAKAEGTVNITVTVGPKSQTYAVTILPNPDYKPEVKEPSKPEIKEEEKKEEKEEEETKTEEKVETKKPVLEQITDEYGTYIKGDVNGDGMINSIDSSILLDLFKNGNATKEQFRRGDMNNDGLLNSVDASIILDLFKSL